MIPTLSNTHDFHAVDRIAVTGARGQLGYQLCCLLGPRAVPLDADDMDLASPEQIRRQLRSLRPHWLINAGAYTAVDAAEADAERCFAINRDAVQTLVEETVAIGCPLVQISTDYVFGGSPWPGRPFREDDPIAPLGIYARSKAEAEVVAQAHPRHLIIRTCGIYGPSPPAASGNFVNTMLRLGQERRSIRVVDDQICCPTYVVELAEAILHLVRIQQRGIFHVVNQQALSWYELARETFRLAQLDCEVLPITTDEYGATAPRPSRSALDVSKYVTTSGPPLSTCRDALAKYLASQVTPTGSPRT